MTPAELKWARELSAQLSGDLSGMDYMPLMSRLGRMVDLLPKLLAHADALAAEAALLQAVVDDACRDGPTAALLIQAAAQERQACCKAVCHRCRAGVPVERRIDGYVNPWWCHPDATGSPDGYGCEAGGVRERGPCRPPLPSAEAVARERAWFRQLLHDQGGLSRADFFGRYGCSDAWAALEARSIE